MKKTKKTKKTKMKRYVYRYIPSIKPLRGYIATCLKIIV